MKFEIGRLDADGVACCGHPLSAGAPVLRFEHNGEVGFVCTRGVCSKLFTDADARLDADDGVDLRDRAEQEAFKAAVEKRADWDDVEANASRAEALAAALEDAAGQSLRLRAEARRARSFATKASRELVQHHVTARSPAFHAAIAWAHVVSRA